MEKNFNYKHSFKEYLNEHREKFVSVITKSQFAMLTGFLTHDEMSRILINTTRPDIKTDGWGNALDDNQRYTNGNIIMCGYPGYVQVELPHVEMLSKEQYECLKEKIEDVRRYNQKIDEQGYGDKYELMVYGVGNIHIDWKDYKDEVDSLLEELSKYVKEPDNIPKEVIVGDAIRPIEEER